MTKINVQPRSAARPENPSQLGIAVALVALLAAGTSAVQAQPIPIPNFSFESPAAPQTFPFVNTTVASWQKNPEPNFYPPLQTESGGITWDQTAGLFFDTNPYANKDGSQLGYILAVPQVALFQTLSSTFQVGQSYNFTVAVYGNSSVGPAATLDLIVYYLNNSENQVVLADTTIPYNASVFSTTTPLNLVDYTASTGGLASDNAAVGQPIGIEIESTIPIQDTSFGNWDIDNAGLLAVPEPSSLCLMAAGFSGLLLARRRRRA